MTNRIFLVCTGHPPSPENSICLGERGMGTPLFEPPTDTGRRLERFLSKHQMCGHGPDHFQLAYQLPKNHDVATPQSAVAPSVRAELASAALSCPNPYGASTTEVASNIIELESRRK